MLGQKVGEAARLIDGGPVDGHGLARTRPLGRVVPHQHQTMLQQRQFVFTPANRGDEPLGEGRLKNPAEHLRRPSPHRAHEPVVVHARDEILRAVDRLGEAGEAGAFAQEFRAHRDDDVEVGARRAFALVLGRGPPDEIDEQLRLVASHFLFEAEQLLELVDEHAQAFVPHAFERGGDGGERRGAGVELASDGANALDIASAPLQPRKFGSEVPKRPARGAHGAGKPRRRIMAQALERELRQDPAAHQRRLAGSRDAMDEHQRVFRQPVDDFVDHLLATEEDGPFFRLEWT